MEVVWLVDFDQPSQGIGGRDVHGAPTHLAGDQIPIVLLPGILQGHDEPFLLMRADIQPGAAEDDGDGLTAPEAHGHGHTRMRGEILRDGHLTKPHVLGLLQLTDHLRRGEEAHRLVHPRRAPVQGIRQNGLDLKVGMVTLKFAQQRQQQVQFARIGRIRFRLGGTFGFLDPLALERIVGFLPDRHGGVGLIEPKSNRQAHLGRDQEQQHHGLAIKPPAGFFIENLGSGKNALRDLRALPIAIIPHQLPFLDVILIQNQQDTDVEQQRPQQFAMPEHPR
jgi:hypothetical protein